MRSLRTTLVAGLTALSFLVVGGFAGLVYARAGGLARETMREELRFRAETFSGLLEVDPDAPKGLEFEVPKEILPDFQKSGTGAYMVIVDGKGAVVVVSPSVEEAARKAQADLRAMLPAPGPWSEGGEEFTEVPDGPGGIPCAMISRSFVARLDADVDEGGTAVPPPDQRRYRIQVALDSRDRDRGLASLAWFLGLAGAGTVAATVGAGLLLARLVLRPIDRMTREAATLTPEDATRRLHPSTVVKELHSLAEKLNSALDRLGAAIERQRRFTSDASHELRTPVSVLLAGTELLLRRPRTAEEYRQGLERQVRTIRRMKEITENLLSLARADSDTEAMARDPVDLGETLESTLDELLPLAQEKGLSVERDIADGVRVRGDRKYLSQLAGNLLSNAVKFTPAGGRVTVRASAEDGEAALDVEDTGPGIPALHLPHVFERFYRVRQGRDATEGAGLGLAIVEWIVEAHGGRITAVNLPGGGAAFRVRLPLDRDPGASEAPRPPASGGVEVPASPRGGERVVRAGDGVG